MAKHDKPRTAEQIREQITKYGIPAGTQMGEMVAQYAGAAMEAIIVSSEGYPGKAECPLDATEEQVAAFYKERRQVLAKEAFDIGEAMVEEMFRREAERVKRAREAAPRVIVPNVIP